MQGHPFLKEPAEGKILLKFEIIVGPYLKYM
jgi:hypothetical protein